MAHFSLERRDDILVASPRASRFDTTLGIIVLGISVTWAVFVTLRALQAIPPWRPVPFEWMYTPGSWWLPVALVAHALLRGQRLTLSRSRLVNERWLGPIKLRTRSWEIGRKRFAIAKWPSLLELAEPEHVYEFPTSPLAVEFAIPRREVARLVDAFNRFLQER